MNVAALSVAALVLAIIVSCVTSLNVGILAIALAWVVGVYIGGIPINTVMNGFPGQLFLTLAGVTLLFTLAQGNGTLDRLAHHAVQLCRGRRGVVPIMFFVLAAALASIGPGNIATAAIMAPMAMATAGRMAIPGFLMAIMVGNGANAGSLSPFAPTGIIVTGLMARTGMAGFEWQTYLYNLGAHALVAFGGYFLFGGWKLFAASGSRSEGSALPPEGGAFERQHWLTLAIITVLIVSVIALNVNVGMAAFAGAVVLVLLKGGDNPRRCARSVERDPDGLRRHVLIALPPEGEGINLIVSQIARFAPPGWARLKSIPERIRWFKKHVGSSGRFLSRGGRVPKWRSPLIGIKKMGAPGKLPLSNGGGDPPPPQNPAFKIFVGGKFVALFFGFPK